MSLSFAETYDSVNRIGCPIHGFIRVTKRIESRPNEKTEADLIDTPWLQRLRRIHQLETAWWVFPSGEHTRLQHCFGAMHLGDVLAHHLYPSLKENLRAHPHREAIPSESLVVETMRLAGLLHDVGHGPFGHSFDKFYLESRGYTHERVSAQIIAGPLSRIITSIGRSPDGPFRGNERVGPRHLAYLIDSGSTGQGIPRWVQLLRPLFQGPFTCDNMDFVLRDAYMCGFAVPRADVQRIIAYSFFPRNADRLCLHLHGVSSLRSFLESRLELFTGVYYHRTVRAMRLHLSDILRATIDAIWPGLDPLCSPDTYLKVDEWTLITNVQQWVADRSARPYLVRGWKAIVNRNPEWKRVYEHVYPVEDPHTETADVLCQRYQRALRGQIRGCRVDVADADPLQRPELISIYNPMLDSVEEDARGRLGESLGHRLRLLRVFSKERSVTQQVHDVMRQIDQGTHTTGSIPTNL